MPEKVFKVGYPHPGGQGQAERSGRDVSAAGLVRPPLFQAPAHFRASLPGPRTSEAMRRALPQDAAQLWASAPLEFRTSRQGLEKGRAGASTGAFRHFVLRVQQVGRYKTTLEAQRAVISVLAALAHELPGESDRFLWRMFPSELIGIWRAQAGWAA